MKWMNDYEYQLDIRLDGKYYCRIYQHGIPGAIASTGNYDTEEEAIEAAKSLIREQQSKDEDTQLYP
jgi:hypothetical protein